jgi:hypothetical protein
MYNLIHPSWSVSLLYYFIFIRVKDTIHVGPNPDPTSSESPDQDPTTAEKRINAYRISWKRGPIYTIF